jgi:hypothetical protein
VRANGARSWGPRGKQKKKRKKEKKEKKNAKREGVSCERFCACKLKCLKGQSAA